jgi:hypothetical protein
MLSQCTFTLVRGRKVGKLKERRRAFTGFRPGFLPLLADAVAGGPSRFPVSVPYY